jgi:hypothetical protein
VAAVTFLGWVALLAGLVALTAGFVLAHRWTQQQTWREVAGVIVGSEVVNNYEWFQPNIRFEYVVDGHQYSGATVRTGLITYNWRGPAERLCAKYPVGARIPVFISSSDPASAVLEPGGDIHWLPFVVTISALAILIGILLVFAGH